MTLVSKTSDVLWLKQKDKKGFYDQFNSNQGSTYSNALIDMIFITPILQSGPITMFY